MPQLSVVGLRLLKSRSHLGRLFCWRNAPGLTVLGAGLSDGQRHRSGHTCTHNPRGGGWCDRARAPEAVDAERLTGTPYPSASLVEP